MNYDLLIQIISEVSKIPSEEISEETNLYLDLGMDSLEFFKMVSSIEEELGAELNYITMENTQTVGELVELIAARGLYAENRETYNG